uniref:Endonuclease/exonuclease/phosphatase domain-containing protein n=2 Tax=Haptolina brevifila TaxID=156173 RepID=A0A7S2C8K5_9EUKA|mmetsp:Transcript_21440/g.43408  ORF Transcript_21440/g.43408 Transcript_21440/m.43408 type:complete len:280 (+) Transcript_21440:453-1292(+)
MASLLSEALGTAPDVLCLQEIRGELTPAIRASAGLHRYYDISPNEVDGYGNLLLIRRELKPSFKEVPFPTMMGRSLLIAECLGISEGSLAVATVHLESLNSAPIRAKQLLIAQEALQPYKSVILAGDFNFDSSRNFGDWKSVPSQPPRPTRDDSDDDTAISFAGVPTKRSVLENDVLERTLPAYVDLWPALQPETDGGHTFDGVHNVHVGDPQEVMRYDRVLARGLAPVSIQMLGMPGADNGAAEHGDRVGAACASAAVPLPPAMPPSDHYGLCAVVAL